jgi:hypothetical protein
MKCEPYILKHYTWRRSNADNLAMYPRNTELTCIAVNDLHDLQHSGKYFAGPRTYVSSDRSYMEDPECVVLRMRWDANVAYVNRPSGVREARKITATYLKSNK